MNSHAKRLHQPGSGNTDAAKAQDATNLPGEGTVPCLLIELTPSQCRVLYEETLRGGKRHRESMLRHRLGVGASVAGDRDTAGKRAQSHEVDSRRDELDQPRRLDVLGLVVMQVPAG